MSLSDLVPVANHIWPSTLFAAAIAILTLFLNPSENDRVFRLPTQDVPTRLLIDSAAPDKEESDITAEEITVVARSAVLTKSVIKAAPS